MTVSFEDASAIPTGGLTALQGLGDRGHITSGQQVLIVGASGGVGIYAVQIAKSFDTHVAAVCSAQDSDMIMGIGADVVIDYAQHDWGGTDPYDLILDMVGDRPIETYVRHLTPEGRMVFVGALGMDTMAFMERMAAYKASSQEGGVVSYMAQVTTDDLVTLGQLLASEEVTSVIDRTFPLEQPVQGHGDARK